MWSMLRSGAEPNFKKNLRGADQDRSSTLIRSGAEQDFKKNLTGADQDRSKIRSAPVLRGAELLHGPQ